MAGIINEKPLLQAEPDEPGGDPPPYVSEMASKIGQEQYANFPPNYSQQNQPQDPHIIMQAPPVHAPGPPTTNSITAVNFAMPSAPVPVGPRSMQMRCHHCQAFIKTKTSSSAKSSAHWACCILFFISCGICSCIPYCMGSCRRVDHSCPNCGSFLGSYNS